MTRFRRDGLLFASLAVAIATRYAGFISALCTHVLAPKLVK